MSYSNSVAQTWLCRVSRVYLAQGCRQGHQPHPASWLMVFAAWCQQNQNNRAPSTEEVDAEPSKSLSWTRLRQTFQFISGLISDTIAHCWLAGCLAAGPHAYVQHHHQHVATLLSLGDVVPQPHMHNPSTFPHILFPRGCSTRHLQIQTSPPLLSLPPALSQSVLSPFPVSGCLKEKPTLPHPGTPRTLAGVTRHDTDQPEEGEAEQPCCLQEVNSSLLYLPSIKGHSVWKTSWKQ